MADKKWTSLPEFRIPIQYENAGKYLRALVQEKIDEMLNPTFHVRKQNPSGCWGFAHRSSLHSRFRRVGSFA